jgi:hypothetical protein
VNSIGSSANARTVFDLGGLVRERLLPLAPPNE